VRTVLQCKFGSFFFRVLWPNGLAILRLRRSPQISLSHWEALFCHLALGKLTRAPVPPTFSPFFCGIFAFLILGPFPLIPPPNVVLGITLPHAILPLSPRPKLAVPARVFSHRVLQTSILFELVSDPISSVFFPLVLPVPSSEPMIRP